MKREWLAQCLEMAQQKADFYSGARKIIRNVHFTFTNTSNVLKIEDPGYTKSKLTMLTKAYVHEESRAAAVDLWKGRVARGKYGSVGFHCFNHYVKGHARISYWEQYNATRPGNLAAKPSRASVMGPCIQSVSLTLMPDGRCSVDCFYRTTELFKKFPADLVFIRDILLAPFDFSQAPIAEINFHFANVTCHPMYFVTVLALLDDPIKHLDRLRKSDKYFFDWAVKWTARYLCKEYFRGIEKFAQAMRVRTVALQKLEKDAKKLRALRAYLKKNHPGYRKDYVAPEENDDE